MTAEMKITDHMMMAFGTPIVSYRWPDSDGLNEKLKSVILEAEGARTGIIKSNVGGWHSETDLFSWDMPCIRTLKKRASSLVIGLTKAVTMVSDAPRTFQFRTSAWANVVRDGCYHNVHNHPNSIWSGTYYVSSGEPDPDRPNNGKLEMLDPRTGINMIFIERNVLDGRYVIDPIPGLMVLFPSWLKHLVHPFFGTGERISVAFNVLAAEKKQEPALQPARPAAKTRRRKGRKGR